MTLPFLFKSELCGIFPKIQFRVPLFHFFVKFSLFKLDICFGKAQNTIILFQYLLKPIFFAYFDNTSLPGSLQAISQCMLPQHWQPRTAR